MTLTHPSVRPLRKALLAGAGFAVAVLAITSPASAHADADAVAAATGSTITINFRPNHGCGPSPTVEVAIQVPVAGATAGPVDGWQESSTPSGDDKTVLEWTGGSLPTTETGSFPVTLTLPDTVGKMVTFPAVQVCENDEELSWLNGDPESDYPVPRILVLPAGTATAFTVDEVPANAPGRDLLNAVIDTTTTTTTPATSSPTDTTAESESTASTLVLTPPESTSTSVDEGFNMEPLVVAAIAIVVTVGGGLLLSRLMKRGDQ